MPHFFSKKVGLNCIMNYLYPIFLNLEDKKCLVVGGGEVAERKVKGLLESKADVTVISPDISEYTANLAEERRIIYKKRAYKKGDLKSFFLVIGATDSAEINELISIEAKESGILCNIVDSPEFCNFFVPSVVSSGDLKIAVSTNGKSPALAKKIRKELENIYGSEYALFLNYLGKLREKLLKMKNINDKKRKEIFENIVNSNAIFYLKNGDQEKFNEEVEKWILY